MKPDARFAMTIKSGHIRRGFNHLCAEHKVDVLAQDDTCTMLLAGLSRQTKGA